MSSARRGWLTVWRAFATGVSLTDSQRASLRLCHRRSRTPTGGGPSIRRSRRRCRRTALPRGISRSGQSECFGICARSPLLLQYRVQPNRLRRTVEATAQVLAGMDLARLGEWTWVLVQSRDWKPILRRVGRDPDSPAFTILDKRQTFLEEALFRPNVDRSRILLEKYRVPLDQLLYVAITHELGHAICHEVDELKAIAYANQLRNTGRVLCEQPVPPPQSRDATRDAANSGADMGTSTATFVARASRGMLPVVPEEGVQLRTNPNVASAANFRPDVRYTVEDGLRRSQTSRRH